jgi:hypothetical protein
MGNVQCRRGGQKAGWENSKNQQQQQVRQCHAILWGAHVEAGHFELKLAAFE